MKLMETIRDYKEQRAAASRALQAECIVNEIVQHTGLSYDEIKTRSREEKFVRAKRAICYHLRVRLNMKMQEIGEIVGLKDHTSVIHHLQRAREIIMIYKNDSEAKLLALAHKSEFVPEPKKCVLFELKGNISPVAYSICKHK